MSNYEELTVVYNYLLNGVKDYRGDNSGEGLEDYYFSYLHLYKDFIEKHANLNPDLIKSHVKNIVVQFLLGGQYSNQDQIYDIDQIIEDFRIEDDRDAYNGNSTYNNYVLCENMLKELARKYL